MEACVSLRSTTDMETGDITFSNRLQSFLPSLFCLRVAQTICSCPVPKHKETNPTASNDLGKTAHL